jgi:hypothetical protein
MWASLQEVDQALRGQAAIDPERAAWLRTKLAAVYPRYFDVLARCEEGVPIRTIARQLGISPAHTYLCFQKARRMLSYLQEATSGEGERHDRVRAAGPMSNAELPLSGPRDDERVKRLRAMLEVKYPKHFAAVALREQGLTFREIGQSLSVKQRRAHDLYRVALRKLRRLEEAVHAAPYDIKAQVFSSRIVNCLRSDGLEDMRQVAAKSDRYFLLSVNFGRKSLRELRQRQAELGSPESPKEDPA